MWYMTLMLEHCGGGPKPTQEGCAADAGLLWWYGLLKSWECLGLSGTKELRGRG